MAVPLATKGGKVGAAYQVSELSKYMQTLSAFRKVLDPLIQTQASDIGAKIESGRNMSRFVLIEPSLRAYVDALVREYAKSLNAFPKSFEAGYLLNSRLIEACIFAQFLDHCGFGDHEKAACDWFEFLAIDAWHEFLVNKWRTELLKFYGPPDESK